MKTASLPDNAAPTNFFVIYDAESASQKRRPKTKGVGSFEQIQSVKQRKADGLRRLRRAPWKPPGSSQRLCIKCSSPVASSRTDFDIVKEKVCSRCEQDLTGDLARSTPRSPVEGATSMMDPFQSGAVREDNVMDWIQQYCESIDRTPRAETYMTLQIYWKCGQPSGLTILEEHVLYRSTTG